MILPSKLSLLVAFLLVLLLAACVTDPETTKLISAIFQKGVDNGIISEKQRDLMLQLSTAGDTSGVWPFLKEAIRTAVDVALALLSVRAWRGGIKNRKGLAPRA